MIDIFSNRKVSISREISKTFEEVYRGTLESVIAETIDAKGEFVIVLDGNHEKVVYDIAPVEHIKELIEDGISEKEAIKMVAKMHNINKSDLYKEYHTRK
jgi:16S rRNA (cytidine1402-2'-O)-methyltransferase